MNDIILEDDDLVLYKGDFKIEDATLQHQRHIVFFHKGEVKYAGEVGVGIKNYLLNENLSEMISEIKKQYKLDGMKVQEVKITELEGLITRAEYEN